MIEYGKIELDPRIEADDGRNYSTPASLALSVCKGLAFWEDYNDDTEVFESVVVDTAGTQYITLEQIPVVIEFLQRVLARQKQ